MIRLFLPRNLMAFGRSQCAIPVRVVSKRCDLQKQLYYRSISTHSPKLSTSEFVQKFKESIRWFDYSKSILRAGGVKLYENIADKIRHEEFFEEYQTMARSDVCPVMPITTRQLFSDVIVNLTETPLKEEEQNFLGLPDTLYSWFLVLELHVWMVMARVMAEKDGRLVRNVVVETMWEDVRIRIKKLQDDSATNISKTLEELSHQFGAAIIAYDEGLMSDDRCLAGALWRRILQQKYGNAASLEILVKYVREQMHELDKLTTEEILIKPDLKWGSISPK